MTRAHLLGLALFLLLAGLIWLGYEEIDLLRQTILWPFRYLVLALLIVLVLTGTDRLILAITRKQQR